MTVYIGRSSEFEWLQQKAKSGARPFYGFCYFEGALTKHPTEFPVLLKIHRFWAQGRTIHQINQELDKQKIKSREGKKWSWAAITTEVRKVLWGKDPTPAMAINSMFYCIYNKL